MNISQFLDKKVCADFVLKQHVIYFNSEGAYPLLFFSFFITKLKSLLDIQVETINVEVNNLVQVKAKLETTFLGQRSLYWLQDISSVKTKNRAILIDYINSYNGPNILVFFSQDTIKIKKRDGLSVVTLTNRIGHKEFLKIVSFFKNSLSKTVIAFTNKIFHLNPVISLDKACMVMSYVSLIARGYKDFIDSWLEKIIIPEKSLFTLSQYFFAKDATQFFTLWSIMKSEYNEIFWVTFWSEQIWRAYNFVNQMKHRNLAEAKRVSFRLPFAFTQRLWRNFNIQELQSAHDFIYSIDYSLKNGGNSFLLELFYSKFLNDQLVC